MKKRLRLKIQGAVQGVGFRPFIYRLATELRLTGWVNNSSEGVVVEIEGERSQLASFLDRLKLSAPPLSDIQSVVSSEHTPVGDKPGGQGLQPKASLEQSLTAQSPAKQDAGGRDAGANPLGQRAVLVPIGTVLRYAILRLKPVPQEQNQP